ncbi:M16 family metallopeptidase [Helicobacter sp. T3_23-1059]
MKSITNYAKSTLKTLIFLTGVITMTTYANQTTNKDARTNAQEKQDAKSTQISTNSAKSSTTLTHTQINGVEIPVIYEYSALIPAGNIQLVFQGGGSINADKIALTALKDEILSLGTSKKGNIGFANALEEKAISLSASSGTQTLNFHLSFLKEYEKDAIDLLGELIHYPNLNEINKAKTALNARILSNKSDFDYLAQELLNKHLFAGTPLAKPSLGTQQDVKNLTKKDIQKSLESSLNLSNAIIIIGGDLELKSTLQMLEVILSDLPQGTTYEKKHFEINNKPNFVSKDAPTQQAYIYFGSPLKMQNLKNERYLARVAGFILGASGFGSRLMEEVRVKRGLAYGAYFRYSASPLISYGIGQLQTKLESQDEAIKVVREVISDFVKNGATQKELDSAKQFLLGSEPLGNETLSQRLSRSFNEYFLGLEIGFYKQELEKIKNLELKTLNDYIKSHPEIAELTFGIITQESKQ